MSGQKRYREFVSLPPQTWALPRPCNVAFPLDAKVFTSLGWLAFAFLWLFVFTIPWENAIMIADFGTFTRLIGMMAGGLGVLAILERQRVRLPCVGLVLTTLLMLWATATYSWSLDPEQTVIAASSYLQLLVMVWLIWELASREREQRRLIQAYVFGTYVSAIDTLYRYLSHQESTYQRYASTGFNANDLALVFALGIPLSYYLITFRNAGWLAWAYRLQLVLTGTAILLTASRGGFLACLMALAIVPLTYARLTPSHRIASILTIAVLMSAGLFYVPPTSWERLATTRQEFTQGTLNERTVIWAAGLEAFRMHPFQGVGAGAFGQSVGRTWSVPVVAHNTFLSVLVEEGVIGFGLLCALMVILAVSAWDMPPLPQKVWIVSLGVWAVGVCSASWEQRKPTWFFFSLLMVQRASMTQKRRAGDHAPGLAEHRLGLLRETRQ